MYFITLFSDHWYVSDDSAFSGIQKQPDAGFRLFNQFAVFTYSQLQNILPDSILGSVSDWDTYLGLDLDTASLPFKNPDEFVLNEDYHRLVLSSKLPRPSKFIEQSISFYKSFCKQLMTHKITKSDLLRGLSAFDSPVVLESPEEVYVAAIEKLSTQFKNAGLLSSADKVKAISQYRSFVSKLRAGPIPESDDWVQFVACHYEVQGRPELLKLFRYSCLCLAPNVDVPPIFDVPVTTLESDKSSFQSCIVSLLISYQTKPHVSSLFKDSKAISRAFRLLGRGTDLLLDKKFCIWNFSKGNSSRRASLTGKMEAAYRKAVLRLEKPVVSSSTTTPSVSRTSSVNSTPSPDLSLNRINVALSRCPSSDREGKSKNVCGKPSRGKKTDICFHF